MARPRLHHILWSCTWHLVCFGSSVKLNLQSAPKWLLIPPAVALLLVLGPLSMQAGTTAGAATKSASPVASASDEGAPATNDAASKPARSLPTLPRTPDLWQMTSALVGVLLLGVGGLFAVRKLRGGATPVRGAAPLVTLRQTLRLSTRQAVHAIEFDDRILLIGEHERGLSLLESGRLPDRAADEAEVLARAARAPAVDEDGAVPKNLVIPRPPMTPAQRAARAAARPAVKADVDLEDFRTLLQKVGRA